MLKSRTRILQGSLYLKWFKLAFIFFILGAVGSFFFHYLSIALAISIGVPSFILEIVFIFIAFIKLIKESKT